MKKIRRELSARMMKAHREGRLYDEMLAIEREGMRAMRDALKPSKARRKSRGKKP